MVPIQHDSIPDISRRIREDQISKKLMKILRGHRKVRQYGDNSIQRSNISLMKIRLNVAIQLTQVHPRSLDKSIASNILYLCIANLSCFNLFFKKLNI